MPTTSRADSTSVLGAQLGSEGCGFALWAPRAERVELALIDSSGVQENHEMKLAGSTWRVFVPGVAAGQRYGYRVHGVWDPDQGLRANPAKLLVDPYARAITAGVDYSGPILDHVVASNYQRDNRDSSASVPLSVVVADSPAPTPIARRRPLDECVIYETHVKGYTQLHPEVPEHLRGKYAGLAYPAVIRHLKELGVNAVELLPVHHFVSEPFIVRRGLSNYWGYNTLGYFAPHAEYCSVGTKGEQVAEFKKMVTALHEADIEVILDVVYNHTCEGGHEGPTLSFRGIDHKGYYRLTNNLRTDYDVTGCGNSLDTSHPDVQQLIIDSLRYWVTEMGVDGFRFDLASTLIRDEQHHVDQTHAFKQAIESDPIFEGIKMIAEPWDVGPYGYQVGRWGPRWSEWNDRYRGYVRDYWRGATHGVRELATRLSGSSDLFDSGTRPISTSVNYVTAHDGFTMRDLVTYDVKHNQGNGESNRDGSDDNRSWNCGVEGETDDPQINELRHRQVRNLLMTMLTSDGVPMITAGDELGRTQEGNNNAYCQDSPLSWLHWDTRGDWQDVTELAKTLIKLRSTHRLLQPKSFGFHEEITSSGGAGLGRYQLAWMNGYSGEMGEGDWNDSGRRLLGRYVSNRYEAFLTWYYAGDAPITVRMPPVPWGTSYRIVASTAAEGELPTEPLASRDEFVLPGRTVVLMEVTVPSEPIDQQKYEKEQDAQRAALAAAQRPPEPVTEASTELDETLARDTDQPNPPAEPQPVA